MTEIKCLGEVTCGDSRNRLQSGHMHLHRRALVRRVSMRKDLWPRVLAAESVLDAL